MCKGVDYSVSETMATRNLRCLIEKPLFPVPCSSSKVITYRERFDGPTPVDRKGKSKSTDVPQLFACDVSVHRLEIFRADGSERPVFIDLKSPRNEAIGIHPVNEPQVSICTPSACRTLHTAHHQPQAVVLNILHISLHFLS